MDFSKVGERILSSVRSARSMGLLPHASDRPEVPARAAAAATIARAIAGQPPHQRHSFASTSDELNSIYSSRPHGQVVEELEEEFYEEDFDPVKHVLEHVPCEEDDLAYLEGKATLRLAQLDRIGERLSRHVMEHHEEMDSVGSLPCGNMACIDFPLSTRPWKIQTTLDESVKGMHLVRELEKDMKIANVICMNGRRHLNSSRNEISRDLIVSTHSKRKQALLDIIAILTELRHASDMQMELEVHVEEGNFFKAFQVLSEYLQVLDSFSELSVIQEMSRGVEVWLGKTLQKLDSLLLGVCQDFREEGYLTVVDAYALIGDVSGLAEKIQSFFMQEVLSETHSVLKNIVEEDLDSYAVKNTRLTYSDLCFRIPDSKFRQCLLTTLAVLFKLMCSYHAIMSFQPDCKVSACRAPLMKQEQDAVSGISGDAQHVVSVTRDSCTSLTDDESRNGGNEASSSGSPWFQLRKDATTFVSQTLQRGSRNVLQLTTSRLSVLLSSPAVCSTSIHQFLKNYEDLNTFILAGEACCGLEAVEFRQKVKAVCENYYQAFHQQNIYALKMVMEKENWLTMPPDTIKVVSFAGLFGDGASLMTPSVKSSKSRGLHSNKSTETGSKKAGLSSWLECGNPFLPKLGSTSTENLDSLLHNGLVASGELERKANRNSQNHNSSPQSRDENHVNDTADSDDENEDLHADFIDEDSQLPSRISKSNISRNHSSHWNDEEMRAHTGSSLCLLRLMDKYARLMQILEIVNVEFFKGICQLFGIFFHFLFESFGQQNNSPNGKSLNDSLTYRLKTALSRIMQDCDQWIKSESISFSSSSTSSLNAQFTHMDITPTSPPSTNFSHLPSTSFGLKERCAGAETIALIARLLHRSKAHLQSMLLQKNAAIVEDFYAHLVDYVPDLTEHIHRTTARSLLHIDGYVDRVATAKWEVKDLGLDHNGYVDLLLGEFKHYKTQLAHGGIQKEVQDLLLVYGLENLAEILIEGLSRVKRCTDEGRALMQLDLQVLINGLQHFVSINVKPKLQIVETFIKAYYLPETEYVHWAHGHPEYSKNQIAGLVNLVATMKGWKRKTRLEVLEKIEGASM